MMESKKNIPKGDFKIGQRVKTLREEQALTQKELADMVAISPSSIARLESGETMTSVSTLLKIADALNTSVSSIVTSADQNTQLQDEISGLVSTLSKCPQEQRTELIKSFEQLMDIFFRYK